MSLHVGVSCDYCKGYIFGRRFKCHVCYEYDLCRNCFVHGYSNKGHSLQHPMWRLLTKMDYEKKIEENTRVYFEKTSNTGIAYVDIADDVSFRADCASSYDGTEVERSRTICEPYSTKNILGIDKLAEDLEKLFLDQNSTDVMFDVRGTLLKAHKAILVARSPVFSAMFQHDMDEKKSSIVSITDFNSEVFHEFLSFLYTAKLESDLSVNNVTHLYELADKYAIQDLKDKCREYMQQNIDINSVCDFAVFATMHCEQRLLEYTIIFLSKNMKDVVVTQKWKHFITNFPGDANEMLIKALNR